MKTAIYSVLFGAYDKFKEPEYVQPEADYFLFTNQENITSEIYTISYNFIWNKDIITARRAKILAGYRFLCDSGYDLIIYHDMNIVQTKDLQPLIDMQVNDLMILRHPIRDCIYGEFYACNDGQKDKTKVMFDQVQQYANEGYPENNGLAATGVIFRRNSKEVLKFCKMWMSEVEKGSYRDQLSFDYVRWKLDYKVDFMDWQFIYDYWNYNSKHL